MRVDSGEIAGVVIADATKAGFPLTYVSPGFEEMTGYSANDMVGRSCSVLQGPETDSRAIDALRQAVRAGREAYVTLLNYRADGTPFWNEVALAPQRDADGKLVQYLGVQKDVTARREADALIHQLAYFDSLTGVANRAALHTELQSALRQAHGEGSELALLFVDLDDFKRINDSHGHMVGDQLLRAVADRLRTIVRPQDLVARPGGDEFTLLIRNVATDVATVATELAGRVITALHEPLDVDGVPLEVRASVGVSAYPRDAMTAEDLLRHADAAMYVAKGGGKDNFHIYRSRAKGTGVRPDDGFDPHSAVDELDRILAERDLTAAFQPIVEIVSGDLVAYEALARGPEGSVLQRPDRLFATAAAAGRVGELDWLCRAVAVRAAFEARLGRTATLFLNCEPSAIGAPCPEEHRAVWERAERELDLMLEITERAVTDRPAELVRVVEEHRAAGRGIALDDLGADVRSLALLPLVAPDVIKLDLSLVQDRPSTDQAAIVSAVAAEHERTGARVLAEGIENEQHLAVARTLGATLGQGWHWGRPGPLHPQLGGMRLRRRPHSARRPGRTPFEIVTADRSTAHATKRLLLPMSHHLEHRALRIGEGAVILSAFQDAKHFTPKTVRRYETLVRGASLVGALGVGLGEEPIPGVRGAQIEADDPLAGEWSVVVLGPHFAGALVAMDLGDTGPDRERRFEFAIVYDRGLVIAAAQTLLRRLAPASSSPKPREASTTAVAV
ncbi:diguanylate cyclase domain-containing protein [Solirubrobacter soli]|uniref:diguanylate cyclase domain-containing protein n=1 Tax=Solirubrobacter soli TaxID=363832 RepID=UPI00041EB9ED|nr:diguanylate cyclase [Solirubrobacter soli]